MPEPSTPPAAPPPALWCGWYRPTPRSRWRLVCRAASEGAAWEALLRDAGVAGDRLVRAGDSDPNKDKRTRTGGWQRQSSNFVMHGERQGCLLSDAERVEYEALAAWYMTWQPPVGPYALGPGVVVINPPLSHEYHCARIHAGVHGQEQRAFYRWLRAHWEMFGEKPA